MSDEPASFCTLLVQEAWTRPSLRSNTVSSPAQLSSTNVSVSKDKSLLRERTCSSPFVSVNTREDLPIPAKAIGYSLSDKERVLVPPERISLTATVNRMVL